MSTIWTSDKKALYPALDKDLSKEVVVVGGGIAGYLTAFRLSEQGKDVAVLEARELFSGTTNKTTAHIDALQTLLYSTLSKKSLNKARLYFDSQASAVDEYEKLINKYNIDCEFVRHKSYIIANSCDKKFLKEAKALKKMGVDVTLERSASFDGLEPNKESLDNDAQPKYPLLSEKKAIIFVPSMAAFDPILFLKGLPVNFEIYENTRVTDVDFSKKQLKANGYTITADKIVIATNFPIINFPGWYFVRMYRSTSYAIAAKCKHSLEGIYQSVSESGVTFRSYKDYLIVGGLDHKTGRQDDEKKFQKLYQKAQEIMPCDQMTHYWSANDCITFDNVPFVGHYSKKSKDIYVITGFNKYGMANAMTASMLVCNYIAKNSVQSNQKILEKTTCLFESVEKYKKLFTPQRYTSIFGFLRNFLSVAKNLLIMPLTLPLKSWKSIKKGEGAIAMYKGRKKAVYIDEQGNPHICGPLCAHLKCQLKFNKIEKTWDCPCHGSRFDIDGNLLVGPSVKNLKKD